MELEIGIVKPIQTSSIIVEKSGKSVRQSEFLQTLALYERGMVSSTSAMMDTVFFKDIVPHPIGTVWDLYALVYERSSLVYNAVNNTADFAIQAGFDIDSSADAKKKILKWMNDTDFELILANIFKQLQIFGNAYLDISNLRFPKLLSPKTMFVKVQKGGNDDGMILGYKQVLDGGLKSIDFSQNEIIHFKYNDTTNNFYGMSELKPVLGALTRYANWTEDLGQILHRFSAPYIHHKVGTPEAPASQATIDDYTGFIEQRLPGEDLITTGAVDIEVIQGTQGMIQMDNLVKSLQDEIIAGLRIPEIFARGGVNSNKAVGDIEMQAFDRKVKALQKTVSLLLEDYLFPKLTTGDAVLIWNEFSVEGEKTRSERLQIMVQAGVPLKVALKMVGWRTWVDEVEKEAEIQNQQEIDGMQRETDMITNQKLAIDAQKSKFAKPKKEV